MNLLISELPSIFASSEFFSSSGIAAKNNLAIFMASKSIKFIFSLLGKVVVFGLPSISTKAGVFKKGGTLDA